MRSQILEAVWQPSGNWPGFLTNEDDLDKLLFERQVQLGLHADAGALEEDNPRKPEQSVQRSGFAHCGSAADSLLGDFILSSRSWLCASVARPSVRSSGRSSDQLSDGLCPLLDEGNGSAVPREVFGGRVDANRGEDGG